MHNNEFRAYINHTLPDSMTLINIGECWTMEQELSGSRRHSRIRFGGLKRESVDAVYGTPRLRVPVSYRIAIYAEPPPRWVRRGMTLIHWGIWAVLPPSSDRMKRHHHLVDEVDTISFVSQA